METRIKNFEHNWASIAWYGKPQGGGGGGGGGGGVVDSPTQSGVQVCMVRWVTNQVSIRARFSLFQLVAMW